MQAETRSKVMVGRKRGCNRSSTAIVDAMDRFGQTILVAEEKKDAREVQREQRESEHYTAMRQQEEKQHGEMVDVYAQAFFLMAQR
ncbi:hypothetical protein R1sor_017278 [Riccia sorocarpa]|uniref:Uncharacterized protein n=1 Tax=Riccia sorocarpa TaxID=122646 RepID=A0ABD3I7G3_9MARC